MIYVDNRIGSGDLAYFFAKWKLPYKLCRMQFGDVSFIGKGPSGCDMAIGIEVKKVRDVLNCITDGRFAGHQLPGLLSEYARVWLVIEGRYSVDGENGILSERRGKKLVPLALGNRQFMFRDLDNWITTMEVKAGVKVRRTSSRLETAQVCRDLYSWWTHKEWNQHRSHLAFEEPPMDTAILLQRPNVVRRIAKELDGIGWKRSGAVAKHFHTVLEMVLADEKEWASIEGIGKKTASGVVESLRGATGA